MATAKMYLNGLTTGVAGRNDAPQKRGEITGWTPGAVRRHTRWLYSVDAEGLQAAGEVGYAVTLTLRDLPANHDAWLRVRKSWQDRLRALGVVRLHWVVEWQRRGVPHLHAAVYFADDALLTIPRLPQAVPADVALTLAWMDSAAAYGPSVGAQHVARITGTTGWLKYLSKHASRGVQHYQRNGKPPGWEKTGRLWGHTGDWPTVEPWIGDLSMPQYWRLRRLVRSWRIADARASGDRRRIVNARTMLRCNQEYRSAVRGVSDWVPAEVWVRLVELL